MDKNFLIAASTLVISLIIIPFIKAIYTIAKDRRSHTKESFEQILKIFMNDDGKINGWLEDKPLFRTIAYQNIPHLKGLKPSYADFLLKNQQSYFDDFFLITDLMKREFICLSESKESEKFQNALTLSKQGASFNNWFKAKTGLWVFFSALMLIITISLHITGFMQIAFIFIAVVPTEFYFLYNHYYYKGIQQLRKKRLLLY